MQRAKVELDALFASNVAGSITAERLREFVESVVPSSCGMHFDDPGGPTTIAAPATFVKAANTSTIHASNRFSMPANNRMQYDGPAGGVVAQVTATLSFTCAANNQVLAFAIAVNGVVVTASKVRSKISTGTDVQAVTVIAHPVLNNGDFIEVWIANDTSASNITIEHGHIGVIAFMA